MKDYPLTNAAYPVARPISRRIIYLRHGEDMRTKYKYDEKLTPRGKEAARDLAKTLIRKYGIPDIIYCSPFYRTRQTRRQMLKVIEKQTGQEVINIIDPRLGRFFTKKEMENPDIRRDTRTKNVTMYETWEDFKARVREQVSEMESNDQYRVIWCIGHTLIIKQIIRIKKIRRSSHIEYSDHVILKSSRRLRRN